MIIKHIRRQMIKSFLLSAFIFGIIAVVPSTCLASSFLFEEKVVTVPVGKSFSLPVTIDPAGDLQYTVRFSVKFPADSVEVVSFSLDSDWMAVLQPSYDLIDNENGQLIKTAGFPSGFSEKEDFGTITFRAKRAGEFVITTDSQSFILNVQSESTLSARPQVLVIVTEAATSLPEPVLEPETVGTTESLPDLPIEAVNLFDIISEPGQLVTPRPVWFSAMLYSIGFFLVIMTGLAGGKYLRKRLVRGNKTVNKKL